MSKKGINAYKKGSLKQQIASADPHRLTLMLMQGAIDKLAYAKGHIERKDYLEKSQHLTRATSILVHLRDTLNMEVGGEMSQNLFALYDFCISRITDAHINNDAEIVTEIIGLLTPIRDAWAAIPEEAKQEAQQKR